MVELNQNLGRFIDNRDGKQNGTPFKSPSEIASEVSEKYGLDLNQIRGRENRERLNLARVELARRLHTEAGLKVPDIGKYLDRERVSSIYKWANSVSPTTETQLRKPSPHEFHMIALAIALSYKEFQTHPSLKSLKSRSQTYPVSEARQIFCYLLYTNFQVTMTEIGQFLGNRDHSTIQNAISVVEKRSKADATFASRVQSVLTPDSHP